MSWQRLESNTVDPTMSEGLEGRLADPLWLLARQWQCGEFRGEDAADPLLIRVAAAATRLDELRLAGGDFHQDADAGVPVEAVVEAEPVRNGRASSRVAAEFGRLLLGVLTRTAPGGRVAGHLRERYPLRPLPDDGLDPAGRRRLEVMVARSLDGSSLAADVAADPALAARLVADAGVTGPSATVSRLVGLLDDWAGRCAAAFVEPSAVRAWDPRRLEYRFDLRASETGTTLSAREYSGGDLDWYHLDLEEPRQPPPVGAARRDITVLPTPLRYPGMPAGRFWEFEDGEVFFGGIEAGPTDLARMALADYAISYGDDWYLVPLRATVGSLVRLAKVEVVDNFGSTTPISSSAVLDGPGRRFRFFELTGDPGPEAGLAPLVAVLATVDSFGAARPLEDVRFLRDEAANLAWAVEHRVEASTGRPADIAARLGAAGAAPAPDDRWTLELWTAAPDNWVPLVPVRLGERGGMMLQRGRMPTAGGAGTRGARGEILEPRRRFLLHEDEIPREGLRVIRHYQQARTSSGGLYTWIGRRKGPGRGEGASGLEFDRLRRGPEQ